MLGLRIVATALAFIACSDPTVPEGPSPALANMVGGSISTPVASTVDVTMQITAADAKPVSAGWLVTFVVTKGGGKVFAGAALTNAKGEAREKWTLGTTAGSEQELEARAVDQTTGEARVLGRAVATVVAGPVATPGKLKVKDVAVVVGSAFPVAALVTPAKDAYGNVIPTAASLSPGNGMSVAGDLVTTSERGTYTVRVVGPGFDSAVAVHVIDRLTDSAWQLTWKCWGGLNLVDSLSGSMSVTSITTTSASYQAGVVGLPFSLIMSGEQIGWVHGSGSAKPNPVSQSLPIILTPDSLTSIGMPGTVVTRQVNADYVMTRGKGKCDNWPSATMALRRIP